MLSLVKPDTKYKRRYTEMMECWKSVGEQPAPWVLVEDYSGFDTMVRRLEGYSQGLNVSKGYGIRPDERRKGYATQALHLALYKCRGLGLEKALVSCNKDNIGSTKAIMSNGGVLENEVVHEGRVLQRYWIYENPQDNL